MCTRRQPAFSGQTCLRLLRVFLAILVLASFVAVQTEAAVADHPHHHGGPNDHCCPGCHGGHYLVLHTLHRIQLAPLALAEWQTSFELTRPASDESKAFSSPRAPPA